MDWGGTRWTTISWPSLVALQEVQGPLLIHELFHRIQPQLGLLVPDLPSDHLDTPEGRYWMQLEWKALSRAIGSPGQTRSAAVGDALAFRAARRSRFPGAAESERGFEINEGLAQYTATVVAAGSRSEAVRSAIEQLAKAPAEVTFVRQFAYPTGAAYGILLDEYAPGWTHRIKSGDDLGKLIEPFAAIRPAKDLEAAAVSYGGPEIRERETRRDVEHKARLAELARCSRWRRRLRDRRDAAFGRAARHGAEYGPPAWRLRGVVHRLRSTVPAGEFGGIEVRPRPITIGQRFDVRQVWPGVSE